MAFGLILSLLIGPFVPADLAIASHYVGAILLSMNEVCIGLLLAMMVRMVFFAVELAGFLISYEIGLMASNSINPLLGSTDATLSSLFITLGLSFSLLASIRK